MLISNLRLSILNLKKNRSNFAFRFAGLLKLPIFATTKTGLVAQLNSALDYGSRGYWFESSQGHLRMKSLHESVGFFYDYWF